MKSRVHLPAASVPCGVVDPCGHRGRLRVERLGVMGLYPDTRGRDIRYPATRLHECRRSGEVDWMGGSGVKRSGGLWVLLNTHVDIEMHKAEWYGPRTLCF